MQEIYLDNLVVVMKNKARLEKELEVKIKNIGKNVFIEGSGENEYLALKILEAISLGFSPEKALQLKDENIIFQAINIRDLTKRKDIHHIKSRLIGTHGKTLKNIHTLSNCEVSLHDNRVGIIGDSELIDEAIIAVGSLIHGSKFSNVYSRLERENKKKRLNPDRKIPIKNEFEED